VTTPSISIPIHTQQQTQTQEIKKEEITPPKKIESQTPIMFEQSPPTEQIQIQQIQQTQIQSPIQQTEIQQQLQQKEEEKPIIIVPVTPISSEKQQSNNISQTPFQEIETIKNDLNDQIETNNNLDNKPEQLEPTKSTPTPAPIPISTQQITNENQNNTTNTTNTNNNEMEALTKQLQNLRETLRQREIHLEKIISDNSTLREENNSLSK